MDKTLLIDALSIAVNNYDYDGEYEQAATVREYIRTLAAQDSADALQFVHDLGKVTN